MKQTLIYFTDRRPKDFNPYSFWFWEELKNRAASGFKIFVYILRPFQDEELDELPPNIQIRTALQRVSPMSFSPFVRSLIETPAESLCLVEPKSEGVHLWPLFMVPQLKQMGVISGHLNYLGFQSEIQRSLVVQSWLKNSDVILSTQGVKPLRPVGGETLKARFEELRMDPGIFSRHSHWSTSDIHDHFLLPGSLEELVAPKSFLRFATNEIAKDPQTHFVFLGGLGKSSKALREEFFRNSLASHFYFPEGLTGAQAGQALFRSEKILVDHIRPGSPLAGLARKIVVERRHKSLNERQVYGLL
ncbi:MAG TPA: hypothetical protein DCL41_10910 [Bdellovibrionales bacterium]|nr:hypothetical protein [Bdellovibrionales bacterium]|tara:strand:+ start:1260 stop:2168 length:909 start_codon:yes stop_codon:yes gene_type:complete